MKYKTLVRRHKIYQAYTLIQSFYSVDYDLTLHILRLLHKYNFTFLRIKNILCKHK